MTRRSGRNGDLFIGVSGQLRLLDKSVEQQAQEKGEVKCLGMIFQEATTHGELTSIRS